MSLDPKKNTKCIGIFLLAMINLSVMVSLRNLPIVAQYGFGALFLYLFVALVFLVPSSVVSAELATGWHKRGGIYIWVREAFGPGWGFFAVWMQWIHNVTWFPAILSFSATALAYFFAPELASNKLYLISFILIVFWSCTFFNYHGIKTSSWFSACGVVAGTILPGCLLIAFAGIWIFKGNPIQIPFSFSSLIPQLGDIQHLVFLTGLFLAFTGLEVSAVHAIDVDQPQKNYPRAILIAGFLSFVLYAVGAISIAIMIPNTEISLIAGLMQSFQVLLSYFHLEWLLLPIGIMIVFGAIGELNAWVIGPVRALHATSLHGDLPPVFQKLNQHAMPINLLFFQGIVVSFVSLIFLFMPSASSAFWILSVISAQLYLLMYILMFLTVIKLRYSHPDVARSYRIPFKMAGVWTVGLIGTLSSALAFLMGFVPPSQIKIGNLFFYEAFLMGGISLMCLIPYLIYLYRDPSWHHHS